MEVWTSVMDMYFDNPGLGVKSQSSSAMAGSCGNIPQYSLVRFYWRCKVRIWHADPFGYGVFSNSEFVNIVERETELVGKLLFRDPNKGDYG